MSGVSVIWSLLQADTALADQIGPERIMAGDLPLNTVLPAISVRQISSVPRNDIQTNETPKLHTDRVQVSVLVKGPQGSPAGTGYPGVKALLALVLAACPSQRGTINEVSVDAIIPDLAGPDLYDDATAIHQASRDFFVRWHA